MLLTYIVIQIVVWLVLSIFIKINPNIRNKLSDIFKSIKEKPNRIIIIRFIAMLCIMLLNIIASILISCTVYIYNKISHSNITFKQILKFSDRQSYKQIVNDKLSETNVIIKYVIFDNNESSYIQEQIAAAILCTPLSNAFKYALDNPDIIPKITNIITKHNGGDVELDKYINISDYIYPEASFKLIQSVGYKFGNFIDIMNIIASHMMLNNINPIILYDNTEIMPIRLLERLINITPSMIYHIDNPTVNMAKIAVVANPYLIFDLMQIPTFTDDDIGIILLSAIDNDPYILKKIIDSDYIDQRYRMEFIKLLDTIKE